MKKLFIIIAVVGVAISISSCKKDYTCDCTYDGQTVSAEINNAKSSDANAACDELETLYKASDSSASCTLK